MIRTSVILTFLFALVFISSCCKPNDLTKNEIYQILNEVIADDSLVMITICSTATNIPISYECEFNNQDKEFINRQKMLFKGFKFQPNILKFYSQRSKSYLYSKIDTTCHKGMVHRLSFPLISADRRKLVIENYEDCNCRLGGQGGKKVFVKQKNGHWKFVRAYDVWISDCSLKPDINKNSGS